MSKMKITALLSLATASVTGWAQSPYSYANSYSLNNPAGACIAEICGPPAEARTFSGIYLDAVGALMRAYSEPTKPDYPDSVKVLFQKLQEEGRRQMELSKAALRASKSLDKDERLSGPAKALYNLGNSSDLIASFKFKTDIQGDKISVAFDESATRAALEDRSEDEKNWVIRVGKYIYADLDDTQTVDIESVPPSVFLKKIYPNLSIEEALKSEGAKARKYLEDFKQVSMLEKAMLFSEHPPEKIQLLTNRMSDGTADEDDVRELTEWNRSTKDLVRLVVDGSSPFHSRPTPPIEDIYKQVGGIESAIKKIEKDNDLERKKEKAAFEECKSKYFLNKKLLPDKMQIDNLKRDIERSRAMASDFIKAKFPSSVQAKLLKRIKDTDFVIPPTANEFERSFERLLTSKLEGMRSQSSYFQNNSPEEIRKVFAVVAAANIHEEKKEKQKEAPKNEYCDSFSFSPASDANYTALGHIKLSFSTATADESTRIKVILHELGHSISKELGEDPQFNSLKKCLADQHSEPLPSGTSFHVEEDFADAVAGNAGKSVDGRNVWCSFLNLTYDRQNYFESSMQAPAGDPHSANLFRLLNFEVMRKGHFPESCGKYLKDSGYKENFGSCFDLAGAGTRSDSTATH